MRVVRIHEDPTAALDPALYEYLDAKAAKDRADARLLAATKVLQEQMEQKHQKSMTWTHDGQRKTVTYVAPVQTVIDEKGLRRALRAKVFDKYTVTTKKLNRTAMEHAMSTGEVDPMVVAKYVTEKPSTPYLKYSVKDEEEE